MAAIPKLNIKKIPIPKAISHKISKVIRVLNGIGFHPPKVLIRKWIKPMMGMPMNKIPEMDNKVVGTGEAETTDQSTCGILT